MSRSGQHQVKGIDKRVFPRCLDTFSTILAERIDTETSDVIGTRLRGFGKETKQARGGAMPMESGRIRWTCSGMRAAHWPGFVLQNDLKFFVSAAKINRVRTFERSTQG